MVISSTTVKEQYVGTGAQTSYSYPNPFYEESDLVVSLNGIEQTLTTHYTVTTGAVQDGHFTSGTVIFNTPPALDAEIWITRDTPAVQSLDFSTLNTFDPDAIETLLDRHALINQDTRQKGEDVITVGTANVVAAATPLVEANIQPLVDEAEGYRDESLTNAGLTAANVVSTNADVVSTNADVVAAELAKTGAETAETNAASSETAAETAQAATEAALESLNNLTDGVFLSRVLRESPDGNNYSFTTVTGGNYLVNCGNLTLGQKVTANLFATPTNATINRFEVKAETNKEFHLDGGTKEIEGHEGTTAFANIHCYLEVAFDEAKDKWVIYEKEQI